MRRMPSPVATATTPQGTGSGGGLGIGARPRGPSAPPRPSQLVEQVGDADLAGPADLDGGLDGGADLVGVDVAVVDAVATDDHDGVADAGPHLPEARAWPRRGPRGGTSPRSGARTRACRSRVPAGRPVVAERLDRPGRSATSAGPSGGAGTVAAVDHVEQGVEQQQEAGAAGVDHAGLLQHRQQLGRVVERRPARPWRVRSSSSTSATPVVGGGPRRLGRLADDGEDRALDRTLHGLVGQLGGAARARRRGSAASTTSGSRTISVMPRSSCDRMTPELPRAPMSEPWATALQVAAMSGRRRRRRRPPRPPSPAVRAMLVPVSPSGTGYTFSRLMASWCRTARRRRRRHAAKSPAPEVGRGSSSAGNPTDGGSPARGPGHVTPCGAVRGQG